jgi:hypothetical protein
MYTITPITVYILLTIVFSMIIYHLMISTHKEYNKSFIIVYSSLYSIAMVFIISLLDISIIINI